MILKHSSGTETYFVEVGDPSGEPILLLHGLGADHRMWEPQMGVFADAGYRVLVPDLLGHGRSSRVKALELEDWENQLSDLLAHLDLERCNIIGVSMGGVIAQSFVMHQPEKVNRLVLCDTFGELKTWKERALGVSQVAGFWMYKLLGRKMMARAMAATYKAPYAKRARDYLVEQSQHVDINQLILARKAINEIDAIGKIDGDRIPTLLMVGDQFGPSFIDINRKIADHIDGAKFLVLENAMDPSNLVNPDAFNREVLDFLQITDPSVYLAVFDALPDLLKMAKAQNAQFPLIFQDKLRSQLQRERKPYKYSVPLREHHYCRECHAEFQEIWYEIEDPMSSPYENIHFIAWILESELHNIREHSATFRASVREILESIYRSEHASNE